MTKKTGAMRPKGQWDSIYLLGISQCKGSVLALRASFFLLSSLRLPPILVMVSPKNLPAEVTLPFEMMKVSFYLRE